MEDAERLPRAFCAINREGSCVIIYLLDPPPLPSTTPQPFTPSCLGHGATPLPSHCPLFLSHLPCGSSHFLAVTSSAFTLTRDTHDKLGVEVKVMACESNAPASSLHTVDVYTKACWHADTWVLRACACAISHSPLSAALPDPGDKAGGSVLQTGRRPGCKTHQDNRKSK